MNVLLALFWPVSPTGLKLCPREVWRMAQVRICTHRQHRWGYVKPRRGRTAWRPVGTSHAVLLLLPPQGWRSAREEVPNTSWCWLCPAALDTGSQTLLQQLLQTVRGRSPWSRVVSCVILQRCESPNTRLVDLLRILLSLALLLSCFD